MGEPTALEPGDLVAGKYRIERMIGRGGMGAVYRAVQEPLGRHVALKTLRSTAEDREELVLREKRFFQEAALTAKLTHPNTVVIYDYGELPDGGVFLVMEYLEGESLRDLLRAQGRLAADAVVPIATQIAASLADAHDSGVVHRDVKPANVMIVSRGTNEHFVKVVDFGLVKLISPGAEELTGENEFVGSLTYAAPERFLAVGSTSPSADMYSLGIVMYELLAGRPPFERDPDNAAHIMLQHLQSPPAPLTNARNDVGSALAGVVHRCLAKDPADRFSSMHEVVRALSQLSASEDTQTEVTVRDVPVEPPNAARTIIWDAVDSGVGVVLLESSADGYELMYRTPLGAARQRPMTEDEALRLDQQWQALGQPTADESTRLMLLNRDTPDGAERLQVRYQRAQTLTGLRIVMELLPESRIRRGLVDIMPVAEDAAELERWCDQPRGLIVVAGHPGSGKTTTSYACLLHAVGQGRTVFTLEEGVGFVLEGTHQMEVDLGDRASVRHAFQAAIQQGAEVVFVGSSFGPSQDDEIFARACATARMGRLVIVEVDAESASAAVASVIAGVVSVDDVLIGAVWQELLREEGRIKARYELAPAG